MSATYCTITELEMDSIFQSEKNWIKEYTDYHSEIVYTKTLKSKPWIQVKVYSSLRKNNGVSAGVGQDAIRVCAINIKTNKGIIKSRRINRVPNWEQRLKPRVEEVWKQLLQ
jgi:hypothetical protein